jgi:hypothetical protein
MNRRFAVITMASLCMAPAVSVAALYAYNKTIGRSIPHASDDTSLQDRLEALKQQRERLQSLVTNPIARPDRDFNTRRLAKVAAEIARIEAQLQARTKDAKTDGQAFSAGAASPDPPGDL